MATTKAPKAKQMQETQATAILEQVGKMDVNKVVQDVGHSNLQCQQFLGSVQAEITSKAAILTQMDLAIDLKRIQIKVQHQIEDSVFALDDLNHKIEEARIQHLTQITELQHAFEVQTEELSRAREQEEKQWAYDRDQLRQRSEDEFLNARATRTRTAALADEEWTRTARMREAELKTREQELVELRTAMSNFPSQLEKEIKAAEGRGEGIARSRFAHELALLQKDIEANTRISNAGKVADAQTIGRLEEQLMSMQTQLDQANRSTKEIATKAAEALSGSAALAAVQQQAQNTANQSPAGRGR